MMTDGGFNQRHAVEVAEDIRSVDDDEVKAVVGEFAGEASVAGVDFSVYAA